MPTYYARGENSAATINWNAVDETSRPRIEIQEPFIPKKPATQPRKVTPQQYRTNYPLSYSVLSPTKKRKPRTKSPTAVSREAPSIQTVVEKVPEKQSTTIEEEKKKFKEWIDGPLSPKFKAKQAALVETVDDLVGAAWESVDAKVEPQETIQQRCTNKEKVLVNSTVSQEVQHARKEFNETFQEIFKKDPAHYSNLDTEYSLRYQMLSNYKKPDIVQPPKDHKIFYPHAKASNNTNYAKVDITPKWMGTGVQAKQYKPKSEQQVAYRFPSVLDVKSQTNSAPKDNLLNNCSFSESKKEPMSKTNVETLRKEFDDEMQRLYRRDLGPCFQSEYDASFAATNATSEESCKEIVNELVNSSLEKSNKSLDTLRSEYSAAFSALHQCLPVDKTYHHRSLLCSGEMDNPSYEKGNVSASIVSCNPKKYNNITSEYMASFNTCLANQESEYVASKSLQQQQPQTEYQCQFAKFEQKTDDEASKPSCNGETKEETEYQSNYKLNQTKQQHEDHVIRPVEPTYTTIYQDSYENHHDGLDYDHDTIDFIEPVAPFYLSEYQAAYELPRMSKTVCKKKQVLKPYYSFAPTGEKKHRLFKAEVNPGFVQRTEYMAKFRDFNKKPFRETLTNEKKELTKEHKDVNVKSVPVQDAPIYEQKGSNEQEKSETVKQNTVRNASQSKKSTILTNKVVKGVSTSKEQDTKAITTAPKRAKWWEVEGKQLWSSFNPITRNMRYKPVQNYFKTPKSEYMSAYA